MDFNLDMEIEDYYNFISILYFNLYFSFNLCSFMFVINMDLLVLMVEMVGYAFYRVGYWM